MSFSLQERSRRLLQKRSYRLRRVYRSITPLVPLSGFSLNLTLYRRIQICLKMRCVTATLLEDMREFL